MLLRSILRLDRLSCRALSESSDKNDFAGLGKHVGPCCVLALAQAGMPVLLNGERTRPRCLPRICELCRDLAWAQAEAYATEILRAR